MPSTKMVGMKALDDLFAVVSGVEVFKFLGIDGLGRDEANQSVGILVGGDDGGRKLSPVLA